MRHFKRICFFLYSCALFAGGCLCSLQMEAFFYPGKGASPEAYEGTGFLSGAAARKQEEPAERASSKSAVRKDLDGKNEPPSFKLIVEDNRVAVYEQETGALYLRTDVDARTLPCRIRSRILDGCEEVSADSLEKLLLFHGRTGKR